VPNWFCAASDVIVSMKFPFGQLVDIMAVSAVLAIYFEFLSFILVSEL
jgi:hypothetical protein